MDFETCKLKAKLKIIDKIKDDQPKPAAERGTKVHDGCEKFVEGKHGMPLEAAKNFTDEMLAMRRLYKTGKVSMEGEWGFDTEWNPVPYRSAWLKVKADATVTWRPRHGVVVDYKTGKRFGNEAKHGEQLELYSLAFLLRNPSVEQVTAELWYFDIDDLARITVNRKHMDRMLARWHKRGTIMTTVTKFPPNPNIHSCKYCPFKPVSKGGSGHCEVGV
jgi:CRISPR/Cas system-associated exonuclease Cas4 (RecB family)